MEAIVIAPAAEAPGREVERAVAVAGSGLEGDRYAAGAGTFSPRAGDGRELTLIEAEVLDALGLSPADARRNVVTRGVRLNALMGYTFTRGLGRVRRAAAVRALRAPGAPDLPGHAARAGAPRRAARRHPRPAARSRWAPP